VYATRFTEYLDIPTTALGFLFEPNSTIASAAKFSALDPGFGLPAVLTTVGSMGGSLRSNFRFSYPCQLDDVIHAAVCIQIMASECQAQESRLPDASRVLSAVATALDSSLVSTRHSGVWSRENATIVIVHIAPPLLLILSLAL
jgi:hypothetical protein